MIKIKSQSQPLENVEVFDVYSVNGKIAISIVAAEGFELVREGEEPDGIRAVDIPVQHAERINLYKSIPKKETEENL